MLDHTHFNPDGWKARADRAAARLAANRSPKTAAVRKARAASAYIDEVSGEAAAEWAKQHEPVVCPIGRDGMVHPQMAALLVTLLAEKGLADHDPLKPLETGISVEDYVAAACAAAQQEYDEAFAELAEIERKEALFNEIMAAGIEGIDAVFAERTGMTSTSEAPVRTLPASETESDTAAALGHDEDDEAVPVIEDGAPVRPPRRGPGRPPKTDQ